MKELEGRTVAITATTDVSIDAEVRAMIDLAMAETGRVDVQRRRAEK